MAIEKRILLVEPPFYRLFHKRYSLERHPLALGYLSGTILRDTDWDVRVNNFDFVPNPQDIEVGYLAGVGYDSYKAHHIDLIKPIWDEIRDYLKKTNPPVLGITTKTQNWGATKIVASIAKELNPEIIVVVGGPHPCHVGTDIFESIDIDIGVQGEGEITIVELLDALGNGERLDGVKGIMFRKGDEIVVNPERPYVDDLDTLVFPHESAPQVLENYDQYPPSMFKSIFWTRGCPYDCLFCGSREIWTRKVRWRSIDNVMEEIRLLRARGVQSIDFADDTFGGNKKKIHELCQALIERFPGINWSTEIHIKLVDDETMNWMKKAGCHGLSVGVESGSNEILKLVRKKITIEEAYEACRIIRRNDIEAHCFFIVGFPWETESTLLETVEAIKIIEADSVVYSIFMPYPGSEAYRFCVQEGIISKDFNISLHNHQSPENCFCKYITKTRFRELVTEVEKMVDQQNRRQRIRRLFSKNTVWRIKEKGLWGSARKGYHMLVGRSTP